MPKPRRRLLAAVFLFLGAVFALDNTLGYGADDSLSVLQQEIIVAKEKHQRMAGKADSVNYALDKEKSRLLEEEANRLMEELTQKPAATPAEQSPASVDVPPAPPAPSPAPASPAGTEAPLPEAEGLARFWPPFSYSSKDKQPDKKPDKKPAKKLERKPEKKLTDGEALYKVAVSDNKITIEESVDIALANNLQLAAAKKKVEVAEAKLVEAKRALFPTVQGVVEYNGGKVGATPRFYKGESQKLNVTQPVFYGGELQLTVKQADANVRSSRREYEKTRNDFIHQVRTHFYGVVKAEYNSEYQVLLHQEAGSIYKRVQSEYTHKVISEIDYLNAQSLYQQVFFQAEAARNDLLAAVLLLRQSLALDPSRPLPVDLKLGFFKINADFDPFYDIALKNNPDYLVKVLAFESAQYGVQIYRAKKWPRVDLRGSYGMLGEAYHDIQNPDLDTEKEWFLGVQTSMPLGPHSVEYSHIKHVYGPTVLALTGSEDWNHKAAFNLFDKLSDITDEKSAQAALLQAQSDLDAAKNALTTQVRDGFYGLQKSLVQIDSAAAKIRYQGKQNEVLKYMLGLQETSSANLIEGLIEQAQNKFSFIQAVTDYHLAISSLALATGDPYHFENAKNESSES